jgi:hypothetical protein
MNKRAFLGQENHPKPMTEQDITTQILRNGKYIFDNRQCYIFALPWLCENSLLALRGSPPDVNKEALSPIIFVNKSSSDIGYISRCVDITTGQVDDSLEYIPPGKLRSMSIPWHGELRHRILDARFREIEKNANVS